MIKVIIADDHQMVIDGIKLMLREEDDISVVGEANDGIEALNLLDNNEVDIILLDINMPNLNGIDTCKKIQKLFPKTKTIGLSMFSEISYIELMIQSGASGYLLKNSGLEEIKEAITKVHHGEQYYSKEVLDAMIDSLRGTRMKKKPTTIVPKISKRERQILHLILQEHTSQEIADMLFISFWTVESHRRNLMKKLNVKNTAGLVRKAIEHHLDE